jgi:hypothetical protein
MLRRATNIGTYIWHFPTNKVITTAKSALSLKRVTLATR